MENKQTAVEWLFDKITQNQDIRWRGTPYRDLFEQAKQMEKEQIIDANDSGFEDGVMFTQIGTPIYDTPEQYYNETYGQ